MRKIHQLLTMAIAGILVGCQALQPTMPLGQDGASPRSVVTRSVASSTVSGRADFPQSRGAQALPTEIVIGSTVSFFDSTGATVATGKTDGAGNFSLGLGGLTPVNGATYVLEAVKGLNGNAPGSSTARLRTILQWNGTGWLSCTNAAVGGNIVLNTQTTALTIESALDATNVPAAQTIGKVNAAVTPATFNGTPGPYTNHPDAELVQLSNDLLASLGGSLDPVASVPAIKPTITGLSPTSGPVNTLVQVTGTGFNPVPAGNTVSINGAAAGVVLASPTSLVVTVGAGTAGTGNVTVTTGRGTATGGTFTLTAGGGGTAFWIDDFSPRSGRPGTALTLKGQFATIGATPSVSFLGLDGQTAYAPVMAYTATTITAEVPLGALPGRVTVKANGVTSTSGIEFDVWQGDVSAMTTLSNPSPVSTNYHFIGDTWGGRYGTARFAQYQYSVSYQNVWMTPLLQNGSIGSTKLVGRLGVGRNWASMVIYNRFMYVIGGDRDGACSTIERATINDDGSLSDFKTVGNLKNPRYLGASVIFGSTLYVLPGAWTGSIERWVINTDTGDLTYVASYNQPFFGQADNKGYYGYSYAAWGNWVYFFGGYYNYNIGYTNQGFALNINSDGSISSPYPGPSLPINLYISSSVMMNYNGNTADIYVLGGYRNDTDTYNNPLVYRANWDWTRNAGTGTGLVSNFTAGTSMLNNGTPAYAFGNGSMIHAVGCNNTNTTYDFIQSSTLSGSTLGAWSILQGTALHGARNVLLGNRVWTIGGDYQSSNANGGSVNTPSAVTRYVTLNNDGSLGAAGTGPSLNTARGHAPLVATKDFVYVLGGGDWAQNSYSSIERAPVTGGNTLGTFMTLPQTLSVPRWAFSAVILNGAIYCFGGISYNGTTSTNTFDTVERIPINTDGTLGTVQVLPVKLPEPLYNTTAVVVGDSVYVIGGAAKYGYNGSNAFGPSRHVLRARLQSDGSLSQFSEAGPLAMPVAAAGSALIGNYVYTFGGGWGGQSTDVQRAAVRPDGSLGVWQLYQSDAGTPVMAAPLNHFGAPIIRDNAIYIPNSYGTVSTGQTMSCAFQYGTIH